MTLALVGVAKSLKNVVLSLSIYINKDYIRQDLDNFS